MDPEDEKIEDGSENGWMAFNIGEIDFVVIVDEDLVRTNLYPSWDLWPSLMAWFDSGEMAHCEENTYQVWLRPERKWESEWRSQSS